VWSCLDFRHTFGSQLAQKGESLYKILELMGNSPEICRKHYAALIPERMRDVVEFDEKKCSVVQKTPETDRMDEMMQQMQDIKKILKGQDCDDDPKPNIRLVR